MEIRRSKFHFVDLAGSERAKRTGASGQRFKEVRPCLGDMERIHVTWANIGGFVGWGLNLDFMSFGQIISCIIFERVCLSNVFRIT